MQHQQQEQQEWRLRVEKSVVAMSDKVMWPEYLDIYICTEVLPGAANGAKMLTANIEKDSLCEANPMDSNLCR